jgi:hypothetical protein
MPRWPLWVPFLAVGIFAIVAPVAMYTDGANDGTVAAWGTWFAIISVLMVGGFAIPQLALAKSSVECDVFLKACSIIDDEKNFGAKHLMVIDKANAAILEHATLADDGALAGIDAPDSQRLADAVRHVLYSLEQLGIIFHYATNKPMIEEYVGDTVITSYEALRNVIESARGEGMYERFEELYKYCKDRWPEKAIAQYKYTNVPGSDEVAAP